MQQILEVNVIEWRVLLWGLPAALLIAGSVGIERAASLPDLPIMRRLGDASYAIYLSHLFSLGAMCWAWHKFMHGVTVPSWTLVGGAVIVSIGCGVLVHHHIEQPLLRRLRLWRVKPRWSRPAAPDLQNGPIYG